MQKNDNAKHEEDKKVVDADATDTKKSTSTYIRSARAVLARVTALIRRIWTKTTEWMRAVARRVSSRSVFSRRTAFLAASVSAVVLLVCAAYAGGRWHEIQSRQIALARAAQQDQDVEQQHTQDVGAIQDRIDTASWKTYRNAWYGFTITHPAEWRVQQITKTATKSAAVYRVGFFAPNNNAANGDNARAVQSQNGFEVAVYDVRRTPQITDTDEYPKVVATAHDDCQPLAGRLYETGDYPAEEFYVPFDDPCYDSTLFYMLVDGQYMYTITPIVAAEDGAAEDQMIAVSQRVPEYFAAVSQFENIDIVRPKPKPAVVKVDAPQSAWYKRDDLGRKVCAKKNDKPGKSKKDKKKHMDMECCLDPDEYPNPHCYYDPGKYGKYL